MRKQAEIMVELARSGRVALVMLLAFSLVHLSAPISQPQLSASAQPFGPGIHRNYWLHGATLSWNGTNPSLTASDGDTVSIILQSDDAPNTHNWYLEFNNDLTVDSYEIPTRSPDFFCASYCLNFTIILFLGQGNYSSGGQTHVGVPHGGLFTYRCRYHPTMHGDFIFNAGPVASFTDSPTTPVAGSPVTFNGTSSWPTTGATITNYGWKFGDGNTTSSGSNAIITHSYVTNGTFSVTLTINDTALESAQVTRNVAVNNPPPAPFDYRITTSPFNDAILPGGSLAVTLNVMLVSGIPENVSLTSLVSPSGSKITTSLNVTSGFPSFHARLSIATGSAIPGAYNITIVAVSSNSVSRNFTFTIAVVPCLCGPNFPPIFVLLIIAAPAVAAVAVVAFFVFYRRRKSRPGPSLLA